jgi:hypothetical protein
MKLFERHRRERGNALLEFAIVAQFWILLFFGTVVTGLNLNRMIQVLQTSRDLAHMYAEGTDFSAASSQNLVTGDGGASASMVKGMDLSNTGNAVIIFSQVRHVYTTDGDCTSGTCANAGKDVFVNRIVIGKSSLKTSPLGNPDSSDLNAQGMTKNPTTDTNDQTTQFNFFSPTFTLGSGGAIAYVVEVYMSSPDLSFLGYSSPGTYARAVF